MNSGGTTQGVTLPRAMAMPQSSTTQPHLTPERIFTAATQLPIQCADPCPWHFPHTCLHCRDQRRYPMNSQSAGQRRGACDPACSKHFCKPKAFHMSKSKAPGKVGAKRQKIETELAHLGGDPFDSHGFVNPPLYRGSTILYPSVEAYDAHTQEYTYGRRGTPTIRALENAVTELEGGAHTVLTCSGLSACGISLLTVVSAGGHVLVTDAVYQPARKICDGILKRLGVEITY